MVLPTLVLVLVSVLKGPVLVSVLVLPTLVSVLVLVSPLLVLTTRLTYAQQFLRSGVRNRGRGILRPSNIGKTVKLSAISQKRCILTNKKPS